MQTPRYTYDDLEKAKNMVENALEMDKNFTRAWALLIEINSERYNRLSKIEGQEAEAVGPERVVVEIRLCVVRIAISHKRVGIILSRPIAGEVTDKADLVLQCRRATLQVGNRMRSLQLQEARQQGRSPDRVDGNQKG